MGCQRPSRHYRRAADRKLLVYPGSDNAQPIQRAWKCNVTCCSETTRETLTFIWGEFKRQSMEANCDRAQPQRLWGTIALRIYSYGGIRNMNYCYEKYLLLDCTKKCFLPSSKRKCNKSWSIAHEYHIQINIKSPHISKCLAYKNQQEPFGVKSWAMQHRTGWPGPSQMAHSWHFLAEHKVWPSASGEDHLYTGIQQRCSAPTRRPVPLGV